MSCRKPLSCLGISAFLWLAMPALASAQPGAPCASFGIPCVAPCNSHHCPPAYKHRYEGAPHIHWQRGCPHPICNPCDLQHWGYYDTCWSPWPFPPNWSHCAVPPPATYVHVNPYGNTQMPPMRTAPPAPAFPTPDGGPEVIQQLPPPRPNGGR